MRAAVSSVGPQLTQTLRAKHCLGLPMIHWPYDVRNQSGKFKGNRTMTGPRRAFSSRFGRSGGGGGRGAPANGERRRRSPRAAEGLAQAEHRAGGGLAGGRVRVGWVYF